jgi:circadian clock protein KaiB
MTSPHDATLKRFEDALAEPDTTRYELTLFVNGASDLSARAIANAKRLCEVHLHDRYQLAVVDVHEDPAAVLIGQVLAAPTLLKSSPLPVRKLVGDLSQTAKVLLALDLPAMPATPSASA